MYNLLMTLMHLRLRFLCMVAVVVAAPSRASHAQDRPVRRDDLQRVAATLARASTSAPTAWPGFAGPSEYLLCQDRDYTVLVSAEHPGSALGVAPTQTLTSAAPTSLFVYAGRLPGLPPHCFTFRYPFRDRQLLAFPMLDSAYSIHSPDGASAVAVLHEQFHQFQRSHFGGTQGAHAAWRFDVHEAPPDIPADALQDAAFGEGARVERTLLAEALSAPNADSTRLVLRKYVIARSRRMRRLAHDLRGIEPHEERKEGTAQYAAYVAVLGGGSSRAPEVGATLREDLLAALDFSAPAPSTRNWRAWHIYASGAAIGVALDKLGCDWRTTVTAGASLFATLAAAVAPDLDLGDVLSPLQPTERLVCRNGTT
jgi:hypothetical protein